MNRASLLFFIALMFSELAFAGRTVDSATVDGLATTSVSSGATISTAVTVTTSGGGSSNDWKSTGWRLATTSGALTCNDHADETSSTTTTKTFNITAPATDDAYNLYLQAYQNDNCAGSSSSEFILSNAVIVGAGGSSELLCSAEASNAVINEIQTTDNFIEIYLLNSTDILNWALYVDTTKIVTLGLGNCEINGTTDTDDTGSGATNSAFPAGTFITCDYNVNPSKEEVLLVDTNGSFSNGDSVVIDYMGYGNLTPFADWAVNSTCGSLYPSHAANNKDIARIPDGTGSLVDNASESTKGTSNSPPSTPAAIAYFAFDELSWNGSANEVVDDSGINNHGVAVGSANTTSDGKICRGADIPSNTSNAAQDAIDTGIDIDDDIGNTGTISFWYKSNNNWSGGGDRALFDASADDLTAEDKYFTLTLKNNGSLKFAIEDAADDPALVTTSNQSFVADEWVHIAATWDLSGDRQVYVNGSLIASNSSSTSGQIGELRTLYMGDNRSTYHYHGTANSANGVIDEVRIYQGVQSQAQIQADMNASHSCTNLFDHFELSYSANGLTCLSSVITLKACANANCSALYTEDVNVTLDPATGWASNPVTVSSGTASLSLQHTTAEDVVVDITASSVTPTGALQCFADSVADATCTINFSEAGFVFDIPVQTACKPSVDVTIAAVKKSNISDQCVSALTGTQSVNFWSTYLSPATGSNTIDISSTTIDTSSPGTGVDLDFDINGEAIFTVQYDDAGQVQIDASHTAGSGLVLTGNDSFVSKPVMLAVFTDESGADCVSSDASCSRFKKAGETFDLKVNAACWTDDADTDFTDNPVTPNFELTSINTGRSLLAPAGGSNGSLTVSSFNFATSDNGSHTIEQSISEVGVFSFSVSPSANYLGETLSSISSPVIGRFYPDHFQISSQADGAFGDNACGTFTYSGQSFSYTSSPSLTITAYNASGTTAVTQNYTGDFIQLVASDFVVSSPTTDANQLGADNTNLVSLNWTAAVASLTDNGNGSLTLAFGNDSYRYLHQANSQIAPFTNAVDLKFTVITDDDGVQTQSLPVTLQPSGEPIRFGRLAINNAHGSELVPLPITIQAEYFNGANWQINSADQCTALNLSNDIRLRNTETASNAWQAGTTTMPLASGSTTGTLSNNNPLATGSATLTLSAPGEGNQGYVEISSNIAANYDWLLGDYDNDGGYDDDATGRGSFGLFKGSDQIIFRREVY